MDDLECKFCNKQHRTKTTYLRHLNTHLRKYNDEDEKNIIIREIQRIKDSDAKVFKCNQCDKAYNSIYNLERHQQTGHLSFYEKTKSKLEEDMTKLSQEERNNLIKLLQEHSKEGQDNKNEASFSLTGDHNTVDNSKNSHNTNNNNINIKINIMNVGDEKTDMLENPEFLNRVVDVLEENVVRRMIGTQESSIYNPTQMRKAIVDTFKEVNCNEEYPENHNLYASNKSPYEGFEICEDGKWSYSRDLDHIKKIVMSTKSNLVNVLDMSKEDNDPDEQRILTGEINALDKNYSNKHAIDTKVCRDILTAAYENKDIIKKTYNKTNRPKMVLTRKKSVSS